MADLNLDNFKAFLECRADTNKLDIESFATNSTKDISAISSLAAKYSNCIKILPLAKSEAQRLPINQRTLEKAFEASSDRLNIEAGLIVKMSKNFDMTAINDMGIGLGFIKVNENYRWEEVQAQIQNHLAPKPPFFDIGAIVILATLFIFIYFKNKDKDKKKEVTQEDA